LLSSAVCTVLLNAASAVGPKYKRPVTPVPAAYKERLPADDPAESWKAAEPRDHGCAPSVVGGLQRS
jgi:hypothetical protein